MSERSSEGREAVEPTQASTTEGLPIAPSMGPALDAAHTPRRTTGIDRRVVVICGIAVLLAIAAALIAQLLGALIALITNLAFYGRLSIAPASPAHNHLGLAVIGVPVLGALVVGLMARYGSKAIRGHGIPEAMEQVLFNQSRIPARMTFLKPLSAAIAIGTGGPFGAEGPIIATGGALGSLVGQRMKTTADERKTLLAAGAAAGMAGTFGSPVAATLLAIELLLFEYRARSLVPVALASAAATAVRIALVGAEPAFVIPDLPQPSGGAIASYVLIGALAGLASVYVTRAVYGVEDAFERLPIHWMWWPAIGAVATGVVGYFAPRTLGVGYDNIESILAGGIAGRALLFLVTMKFLSWVIALGSGTSGGTLAPLLTIGGGFGALLAAVALALVPGLPIDVRMAGLVGMAAMFAGASRAVLASVVFAFESTRQAVSLLPLLGGCGAAYLVSCLLMKNSIMTEKIARRGARVPADYSADFLDTVLVRDHAQRNPVVLRGHDTVGEARAFLSSGTPDAKHQGFPVVDDSGALLGVVTRRDVLDATRSDAITVDALLGRTPVVTYEDESLREAADRMVLAGVGRLPVIDRRVPGKPIGIITRSDLLAAHVHRIEAARRRVRSR
ncbi:Chloride channel protein [Minicystis rosea]|nr:Chloride channel protein [Minicystis rosea]